MPSSSVNRRGIFLMVAASGFFAANDACTKLAAAYMPTSQMMALRGTLAAVLLLGVLAVRGGLGAVGHVRDGRVLVRAGMEATVAFLYITSLAYMALSDASAVLQMAPLFTTALAVMLFGARVGWTRWIAIAAGFVGVLLIVRPGSASFEPVALMPLAAAFLVAVRDFVTASIPPRVPTLIVTLATAVVGSLLGFAMSGAQEWRALDLTAFAILGVAACNMVIGHMMAIAAFRGTAPEVVSPFRYANMPFAVSFGALLFGTVPDLTAIGGIALIIGAGLYNLHQEWARRGHPAAPQPAAPQTASRAAELAKGEI